MPPKNRATEIYADLKKQILSGMIVSDKALTESRLAEQFGVSRNTVKKALLMLENDGLLTMEDSKTPHLFYVSLQEVSSLLDLRALLEAYIVENATPNISKADIAKMDQYLEQMRAHVEARELLQYIKCNQSLHETIYSNCNNKVALRMLAQLKDLLRKYNAKTILVPGRDVESLQEHIRVVDAIKAGDAAEASRQMKEHILNLKRTFEQNIELLIM